MNTVGIILVFICVSFPMTCGFLTKPKDDWEEFCRKDKTSCSKNCRRQHLFDKLRFFDCSRVCKASYVKCCDEMSTITRKQNDAKMINLTSVTTPKGDLTNKTERQTTHGNKGGSKITSGKVNETQIKLSNATGTYLASSPATKTSAKPSSSQTTQMPSWNQQYPSPPTYGCSIVCRAERYTCQRECHLTPYDFGCLPECDVDYEDCERECFFKANFRKTLFRHNCLHYPNCNTG